jgi:hypothetical protein
MNTKIIGGLVAVVVIGGAGFFGGMKYQSSQRLASVGQFAGMRNGQFARGGANGGFISGEVLSKDSTSVTVKLANGGSSIVFYSPTTSIEKAASGSWDDIVVGKIITVRGTQNADGSYTAQMIQLSRPQMRLLGSPMPSPAK